MKLQLGDRQWVEVVKDDGTVARFMVMGLDRGRLHLSAEHMSLRPDGESSIILEQSN